MLGGGNPNQPNRDAVDACLKHFAGLKGEEVDEKRAEVEAEGKEEEANLERIRGPCGIGTGKAGRCGR